MEAPGEKLIIKLWETLAEKAIGGLLTPYHLKRVNRANLQNRREELLMLAQAELEVIEIKNGTKRLSDKGKLILISKDDPHYESSGELKHKIEPSINFEVLANQAIRIENIDCVRRQVNSAKAIIYAEEILENDTQQAPKENIDDDWLYSWQTFTGNVSTESLQKMWGAILAGELKSPGTYSLRTLEFLKGLSKTEAEAENISLVAKYNILGNIIKLEDDNYFNEIGLDFNFLLEMQNIGIISGVEAIGITVTYNSNDANKFIKALVSCNKVLVIKADSKNITLILNIYSITKLGKEIMSLGNFDADIKYLNLLGIQIVKKGFSVSLGDWNKVSENTGRCSNEILIDLPPL